MATGRTHLRYTRFYCSGYDLSSDAEKFGPLAWTYPEDERAGLDWTVKGVMMGHPTISIGSLNGMFNSTETTGLHAIAATPGSDRNVMIPIGIKAAPAAGDQVFMGVFPQTSYTAAEGEITTTATVGFGEVSQAAGVNYEQPWGILLHAKAAETAANTATGIDDVGAATAKGGYLMYQIFAVAGTGNVTIKAQDAATNSNASFADITNATSGAIAHTAAPASGVIQLGTTAAVRRYLRWQIVLSGITSVTFALAFVRGR